MLSLTKSLVLLLLASDVQVARGDSCATANDEEGDGKGCKNVNCTTHSFAKGETFNITSSTNSPGCTATTQYAYVTEITIARTDLTSVFSYTTLPHLASNNANCAQTSETCRNDGLLTCGKGDTSQDSVVSVTCGSDECSINYYVTWACADVASTTASTSTPTPTTTVPATVPNGVSMATGAGFVGLAAVVVAALLQL